MANDKREFYDHGWNARVDGKPFDAKSTRDWKDGWKDCVMVLHQKIG